MMKCELCKKILKQGKESYEFKETYILSLGECEQFSRSGSSVNNVYDYLICKKCKKIVWDFIKKHKLKESISQLE